MAITRGFEPLTTSLEGSCSILLSYVTTIYNYTTFLIKRFIIYCMKINWFPGHMAKSINDIENKARIADLFILVVDGRCPISSLNENFLQIAKQKMTLVIVTKIDLADKNKFTKIKNFLRIKNFLFSL